MQIAYLQASSDTDYMGIFEKFKTLHDGFDFTKYTYQGENGFDDATKDIVSDGINLAFAFCPEEMFEWESEEL